MVAAAAAARASSAAPGAASAAAPPGGSSLDQHDSPLPPNLSSRLLNMAEMLLPLHVGVNDADLPAFVDGLRLEPDRALLVRGLHKLLPRNVVAHPCASCKALPLPGERCYPVEVMPLAAFQEWSARSSRARALRLTPEQCAAYAAVPIDVRAAVPVTRLVLAEAEGPVLVWLYWQHFVYTAAGDAAGGSAGDAMACSDSVRGGASDAVSADSVRGGDAMSSDSVRCGGGGAAGVRFGPGSAAAMDTLSAGGSDSDGEGAASTVAAPLRLDAAAMDTGSGGSSRPALSPRGRAAASADAASAASAAPAPRSCGLPDCDGTCASQLLLRARDISGVPLCAKCEVDWHSASGGAPRVAPGAAPHLTAAGEGRYFDLHPAAHYRPLTPYEAIIAAATRVFCKLISVVAKVGASPHSAPAFHCISFQQPRNLEAIAGALLSAAEVAHAGHVALALEAEPGSAHEPLLRRLGVTVGGYMGFRPVALLRHIRALAALNSTPGALGYIEPARVAAMEAQLADDVLVLEHQACRPGAHRLRPAPRRCAGAGRAQRRRL